MTIKMERLMNKQNILDYLKSNKERYSNQFGINFIGLFGSFARDEANKKSDIDILYEIEENKKLSMFKYLKLISELENSLSAKIDLVRTATLKPQIKSYVYQDLVYV
jgi:predicted nucleotidyltransferase